ncbi:DUF4279 domain-containing protein [Deinococcus humi]|uniref:DUF4279 domain-containing protein n=1 Tax=Deinococcus humi TaxID=662880 RepID=A0A7W8NHR0_9DEIO|nr:DUF4279 domain-containing protein [Deinococcus humi]MBB5366150.1 hypothetical protein [Deinococcus humi]GGO40304.1 hypothetical protein GCM10008949_49690 [Deinococcus humi]
MTHPTEQRVREVALNELTSPTLASTTQFFGVHPLQLEGGQPRVHGVLTRGDLWEVYFKPETEPYFLVMLVESQGDRLTVRGCRAQARARVCLSITSKELSANDITAAVTLAPTEAWSKGDARTHPRQQHLGPYTFTRWSFCPDGDLPGRFEDKLTRLLDLTEPAAPRIRALIPSCMVSVVVGYWGYTQQMWGVGGTARDMARIAALGADLDIDLYASGPELID